MKFQSPSMKLIFDGNCRVCIGLKDVLVKMGVIDAVDCIAYQALIPEIKNKIEMDQFRNGVALMGLDSDRVVYGSASIAFLFERAYPSLKYFFRIRIFFMLFSFFYKLIAYNRYVIFLPKRPAIECDCYPDHAVYYRGAYVMFSWFIAAALFCLPGFEMMCYFNTSYIHGGILSSIFIIFPFLTQLIFFAIIAKEQLYEYSGHLGSILLAGSIIMLPSGLFGLFTNNCSERIVLVNFAIAFILMLKMHDKRSMFIQLTKRWQFSLLLLILSSLYLSRFF